jgi:O-acetyl-ADP-ribose deacetylase (regulator of RNase III)
MPLTDIARYDLPYKGTTLVIARGSVVDYRGDAIVNAANEGCLGGGGVDGEISREGGPNLAQDRRRLPILLDDRKPVRCKVGMAVITGPNDYGKLPPYIIHAVGPHFDDYRDAELGVRLLKSTYFSALHIANENRLQKIGFSLLSAGAFRGRLSIMNVMSITIDGVKDWAYMMKRQHQEQGFGDMEVKEIFLCAFTAQEYMTLKDICDHLLPASQK